MMKKALIPGVIIPALLFAVSLLSFGWIALNAGFFGEDVSLLWITQRSGFEGIKAYFGGGGIGSASITTGLIRLFGQQAWVYHLLALLVRWLGAWLFWLLLQKIWPRYAMKNLLAALIFLVYPGLKHQPLSISILPHLLALFLTAAGFLLLHEAIVHPYRRRAHFIAASLTGAAVLISDFFIGFEILRIFLIWKDWRRDKEAAFWSALRKSLLSWAPFAFFLALRIGLGSRGGADGLVHPFQIGLVEAGKTGLRDLVDMIVLVWRQIFQIPQARDQIIIFGIIIVMAGLLAYLSLNRLSPEFSKEEKSLGLANPTADGYLVAGLAALLAGGMPLWLSGINAGLNYPDSLSLLVFLPGAALIIVGLLDMVLLPRFQPILAAALVALSVGSHVQNAFQFSADWERAESLVAQFHERAPALRDGTVLVSEQVPLNYYSAENLSALFNLVYFPVITSGEAGLAYLDAAAAMEAWNSNQPFSTIQNGFEFHGSLENALVFYQPGTGCLRVIEKGFADPAGLPYTLGQFLEAGDSHLDVILFEKMVPLPDTISSGAAKQRCMVLGQIEQANQSGERRRALITLENHLDLLKQVEHSYELAPLITAAANESRVEIFQELVRESEGAEGPPFEVCQVLRRLESVERLEPDLKISLGELSAGAFCKKYD